MSCITKLIIGEGWSSTSGMELRFKSKLEVDAYITPNAMSIDSPIVKSFPMTFFPST